VFVCVWHGNTSLCCSGLYATVAAADQALVRGQSQPSTEWLSAAVGGCVLLSPCSACSAVLGLCYLVLAVGQWFLAWLCYVPGVGFVRDSFCLLFVCCFVLGGLSPCGRQREMEEQAKQH
jgi:hypothetical protein